MRKALIGLVMAATVLTPFAAQAQDGERDYGNRDERREARQEARQERQQARQERQESRQERQQVRQENRQEREVERQQRVEPRQPSQTQAAPVSGWGGSRTDPRMREYRERYDRSARENARRYGSEQQYRDVVRSQRQANREAGVESGEGRGDWRQDRREHRRDDRRDWRNDRRDDHGDWRNDRRDWREDRRDDRRDWRNDRRDWREDRRDDRRDWRNDRRDWRRDWNREWRSDRRYDWNSWRYRNRHHYRQRPYYSPYRNWSYRRFSIGLFLQPLFYSQNYWLSDPYQYRLPPAPPGAQWVRYYNDVLLVDVYSGEVIDVIYDFFW